MTKKQWKPTPNIYRISTVYNNKKDLLRFDIYDVRTSKGGNVTAITIVLSCSDSRKFCHRE